MMQLAIISTCRQLNSGAINIQESCAIANMTAQCVLYNMGALKTLP